MGCDAACYGLIQIILVAGNDAENENERKRKQTRPQDKRCIVRGPKKRKARITLAAYRQCSAATLAGTAARNQRATLNLQFEQDEKATGSGPAFQLE